LKTQEITFTLPKIKVIQESRKAFDNRYRVIVNQGGTRSGKTFSIIQLLIFIALTHKVSISVCSVAFPHLRKGAMRDWRKIMEDYGLYSQSAHMKTEQVYTFPTGSYIEFFSVDNALKVRGPGRDILFINEANIIEYDTFRQLLLRTRQTIFIDYNPADEFHWLYDKVLTRKDCYFIKSTYKDNPFLPKEQVREIESYKDVDENFWRIYGEGERGHSEGIIYPKWELYSETPKGQTVYGLDFGYNNPTALIKVTEHDRNLYWEEKIYQSNLTNQDLISLLKRTVTPHDVIFADYAEPQRIEEIRRAGFNIRPTPAKDVKDRIDNIKSKRLFIHRESVNTQKEIKSYSYEKNKDGKPMKEVPIKLNDHAMDAAGYAVMGIRKQSGVNLTFHK
jgi:phage terminase large subunit